MSSRTRHRGTSGVSALVIPWEHSQLRSETSRENRHGHHSNELRHWLALQHSDGLAYLGRPPFVIGLLITVLGCLALASIGITSLVSVLFYGSLLAVMGIAEIVHAFRIRKTGPFLLFLLGGVLSMVVGIMVLSWPGAGLAAMTLLLAGYFFATGLFRTITSVMDRSPRWGWDCADGIISIALGVIIMAQWPLSTLWAVGVVVGVAIISRGRPHGKRAGGAERDPRGEPALSAVHCSFELHRSVAGPR